MGVAAAQRGIVGWEQALGSGLTRAQIRHLVRTRVWTRVHPKVYAVSGFSRTAHQRLFAACLWADGLASHRSAAWLYGLLPEPAVMDVMTARQRPSSTSLRIHRVDDLEPNDRTRLDGIPSVSPTRLLCHLADDLDEERFEALVEEVLRRRLTSIARLRRRLEALSGKGRRGTAGLRRILELRGSDPPAESFLEVKAIRLLRKAGLHPCRQFPVGRRRIDLAFPDVRLGIELLGGGAHDGATARARDANRHNELAAFGWTVLYFTYEDVKERPAYVLATIKAELSRLRRAQALF